MDRLMIPSILRPDYTWPWRMQSAIQQTTPQVPAGPGRCTRILWGIVHKFLYYFSQWYCSWFGLLFDANIIQLPFGLVMKWTDRTSVEEAVSMQMARSAGMPVPKVISCSHKHRIVFTHGDFKAHNILVDDDGHLSGFLDWESAGWYPEYWEFTTAMRFGKDSWWFQVASWMGGAQYLDELESDVALNLLTVDSYIAL
ncbi:hypothetical protein CIHG_02818 [Coccidioides immitis H538.4]|uniref:Aminoglycoside phosphotransferase domain-containing protein n=1 Tax=Coccidioides immitis H538.4 TaxID=396776 RepID=A0A0J8RIU0_COCIT|nr:hypothetical protein CIHG_02818 [Coccidioides immitis H538.4]